MSTSTKIMTEPRLQFTLLARHERHTYAACSPWDVVTLTEALGNAQQTRSVNFENLRARARAQLPCLSPTPHFQYKMRGGHPQPVQNVWPIQKCMAPIEKYMQPRTRPGSEENENWEFFFQPRAVTTRLSRRQKHNRSARPILDRNRASREGIVLSLAHSLAL